MSKEPKLQADSFLTQVFALLVKHLYSLGPIKTILNIGNLM